MATSPLKINFADGLALFYHTIYAVWHKFDLNRFALQQKSLRHRESFFKFNSKIHAFKFNQQLI
jgi:hypothetical protein